MPTTTAAPRAVPTRRISFDETLRELPVHFARDGDIVLSHVAACLSSVFPDGEDYFVRSVRHFRAEVTDPALKPQVAGFIGQEAMHGREHRAFNRRLAELGYPTLLFEKVTRAALAASERLAPPKVNLAATAALEHFTATLAELVLADEDVRGLFGHHSVRDLFLWHALEECEHKAVAFDVYRSVGGTERMRALVMNVITAGFIGGMVLALVVSLASDRVARRHPMTVLRSLRWLRRSPVVSAELWRRLRAYNRRGFHPDDRDTASLVDRWRAELFGTGGRLNDRLAGTAA